MPSLQCNESPNAQQPTWPIRSSIRSRQYRHPSNHHHHFHSPILAELVQIDMALQRSLWFSCLLCLVWVSLAKCTVELVDGGACLKKIYTRALGLERKKCHIRQTFCQIWANGGLAATCQLRVASDMTIGIATRPRAVELKSWGNSLSDVWGERELEWWYQPCKEFC